MWNALRKNKETNIKGVAPLRNVKTISGRVGSGYLNNDVNTLVLKLSDFS